MKRSMFLGTVLIAGMVSAVLSGCGPQQFIKQNFSENPLAAGSRYLPGKVDIVIVVDNSPSISTAYSTVQAQLGNFAQGLKNKYWDFHLAKVDMWNPTDINKVLVNPEFNSAFLPDGSPNASAQIVPESAAITDASQFKLLEGTVVSGNADPTYDNLIAKLNQARNDPYTNFLRGDALLAVIVITNGADRLQIASDSIYSLNGLEMNILAQHAQNLIALKGSRRLVRFYPVAADGYYTGTAPWSCLVNGGHAWNGLSYHQMIRQNFLDGMVTNFCDAQALGNVMTAIDENLTKVREDYVYSAIVLKDEPILNTVRVMKNGVEVPQGETDGWTYEGFGTTYTISAVREENGDFTSITPGLNQQTGYIIRLNGSAQMTGTDVPEVLYQKP